MHIDVFNNTAFCLLLRVSVELRHLQGVNAPIFKNHQNNLYYDSNTYYIVVLLQVHSKVLALINCG